MLSHLKSILFFVILFSGILKTQVIAQSYPSLNITLLSHLNPETDNTNTNFRKYSGCWGWFQSSKNREYALVGTSAQTYFIDVTNPVSPIIVDSVKARRKGCTWREIKTYQNYCYMVSDDESPNSFQIIDMQYLPDSVHVVYDDTTYFERCHTIFVDKDKLYCGGPTSFGANTESMRVYSLANPEQPVLLRQLAQDVPGIEYVHDMFVRNDTIYASCGNQGLYFILLNQQNKFQLLNSYANYPQSGYNHSSWITNDGKTLVFADEVPAALDAKVLDVTNVNNISLKNTFRSNDGATAHNPYVVGNKWCWMSSYQDGLYLYDISSPFETSVHGYFDTHPQHGVNDNFVTSPYKGNWGAYPYLPSKIVIATDMQNGIFILDGDYDYKINVGIEEKVTATLNQFEVFPNPSNGEFQLIVSGKKQSKICLEVIDMLGRQMEVINFTQLELLQKIDLNFSYLPTGIYHLNLKSDKNQQTKKISIQH
jgi:choice-of-anchor B domain-containing protein